MIRDRLLITSLAVGYTTMVIALTVLAVPEAERIFYWLRGVLNTLDWLVKHFIGG
jgi:hypothetical protein